MLPIRCEELRHVNKGGKWNGEMNQSQRINGILHLSVRIRRCGQHDAI